MKAETAALEKDRSIREARTAGARVPELDGLRGLAILLVILCHYVGNPDHSPLGVWGNRALMAFNVGWSGVDLFFVLSGFLIGGILLEERESPNYFRAFYMRRVFRILPIYYAWISLYGVLVVGALWLAPGRFPINSGDLRQVPLHLLFLQNFWVGMPKWPWIWFVVTWSLAVEEQFYLIAPLLIRYISERRLAQILVGVICTAPLLRYAILHFEGNPFIAAFPMPCRADALGWGILLAIGWRQPEFHAYLEQHRSLLGRSFVGLLLGAAAMAWWLAKPPGVLTLTLGLSWLPVLFSCLLLVVLTGKRSMLAGIMRWSWLRNLGVVSYCVYIVHDTFNWIVHGVLFGTEPQLYDFRGLGAACISLALTLLVAAASWRWIEKPLIRRGHSYSYGVRDRAPKSSSVLAEVRESRQSV